MWQAKGSVYKYKPEALSTIAQEVGAHVSYPETQGCWDDSGAKSKLARH